VQQAKTLGVELNDRPMSPGCGKRAKPMRFERLIGAPYSFNSKEMRARLAKWWPVPPRNQHCAASRRPSVRAESIAPIADPASREAECCAY
jgi:hypothetical protein